MTISFGIRSARQADLQRIDALWIDAGRWLAGKGQNQWQYPLNQTRVESSIARGECWMVTTSQIAIATVTLDSYADPDFWIAADHPQDALYLHRIIVAREWSGHKVGAAIVAWALQRTLSAERRWLRLDAWRSNESLKHYYLNLGFTHVRTVSKAGRNSGELFQLDSRASEAQKRFADAPQLLPGGDSSPT